MTSLELPPGSPDVWHRGEVVNVRRRKVDMFCDFHRPEPSANWEPLPATVPTHYEARRSRGPSLSTCLEGDKHKWAHSEEGDGT